MKKTLAALTIILSGCTGSILGTEMHDIQYPERLGTSEIISLPRDPETVLKALIHWVRADQAEAACHVVMPYTDAGSCMVWRTKPGDQWLTRKARDSGEAPFLPAKLDCVGWVVPNDYIISWEVNRCIRGMAGLSQPGIHGKIELE